jgi:hypothetical protein
MAIPGGRELRKKKRRPYLFVARISIDDKKTLIPCAISNISEGGARIELTEDPGDLPITFGLLFSPKGPRRECLVAWRTYDRCCLYQVVSAETCLFDRAAG